MKKQTTKKFTKEWVELTLCDMVDEIVQMMRRGVDREEIVEKIKIYSADIYDAQ